MNRLAFTPQRWHSSPARRVSSARTISAPSSTSRARGERSPGLPSGVATTHNFGDVKDMAVIIQFEGCARVTDADKIESAGNIPFPACGQVGSGGFDHAAAFGGRHARLGRSKAPLAAQTDFDKNQFVPVPADKIQFIRTAAPIAGEYPHPGLFQPIRGGILSGAPLFLPQGHKSEPCRAVCCSGKTPRNVFRCMGHGPSSRRAAKCSLEP